MPQNGPAEAPLQVEPVLSARICSECSTPLPAGSHPGRQTCSPECARARELARKRDKREQRALNPVDKSVAIADQLPGPGRPENVRSSDNDSAADFGISHNTAARPDLLGLLVTVAGQLPPGWRGELGAEGISLHWAPGFIGMGASLNISGGAGA